MKNFGLSYDIPTGTIKRFKTPYEWLSNFYYSPVEYNENIFPTVENAFQLAKVETPTQCITEAFMKATPKEAKAMGRRVKLRVDWDIIKVDIMHQLLISKFTNDSLRDKLLGTGNVLLQEGNYWNDDYWGIDLRTGKGKNTLGNLLMRVRTEIEWGLD